MKRLVLLLLASLLVPACERSLQPTSGPARDEVTIRAAQAAPEMLAPGPTSLIARDATPPPPERPKPTAEEMARCATSGGFERSSETYWRSGTFEQDGRRIWYSNQLCAMGEPTLSLPEPTAVRVRFLYLRTFNPGISVRIEHDADGTRLYATELSGAGGYDPGSVKVSKSRVLSEDQWSGVLRKISTSEFWSQPTSETSHGIDGSQWIIEVAEPNRYHVVDRWSGGSVEPLGRHLLELSGLGVERIY